MISFDLTDEQRLLEQSVREWGAREIAPRIREDDRQHRFDRDRVLGGMTALGLLGASVPQEYGGAGMDYISLGIASEELEYADTSLRVIMSVHAGLNWISLADLADNFLVFAWTDPSKKRERDPSGISAFIVERTFKGFSSGPMKEKWGILAGNTGWFTMDDVEVPEENLLGR